MQHYVYFLLMVSVCALGGRRFGLQVDLVSVRFGPGGRPMSSLRLVRQTRCGCIDHWHHCVPCGPRLQSVNVASASVASTCLKDLECTVASFGSDFFFSMSRTTVRGTD